MHSSLPGPSAEERGKDKISKSDNDEIEEGSQHGVSVVHDRPNNQEVAVVHDRPNNQEGSSSSPGASASPCCIFKIPQCLTHNEKNSYGYLPTIVSIGPYHHGNEQLQWIQRHKEKFQELFESESGVKLEELVKAVNGKIDDIKESYFDLPADVKNEELKKMMVFDGCFLLTLFLTSKGIFKEKHPILNMPWALASIRRDLLLLENQIPFVVLRTLLNKKKELAEKNKLDKTKELAEKNKLDETELPEENNLDKKEWWEENNLNEIALEFFSPSFKNRKLFQTGNVSNLEAKHLLHLIHQTFIPNHNAPTQPNTNSVPTKPQNNNTPELESGKKPSSEPDFLKLKLSAKNLYTNGVKFKLKNDVNTFLKITFEHGVLQIPELILDDFISVVLLNCIAFEQFYACPSPDITSYIMFMGCLINNERDAQYLVEKGIIQNYLGTDDEVVQFFKRILNDYVFDIEKSYLADVVREVNQYSSNPFYVGWAKVKHNYASSPLIFISKLAAFALLMLTIAQVVLAAIAL